VIEVMHDLEKEQKLLETKEDEVTEVPSILEEINIEELAVDGICGIY
jgi:mycofactocin precursor